MKQITIAFGLLFTILGVILITSVEAAEYESVHFPSEVQEQVNVLMPCVEITMHTERIKQDELLGGFYQDAFRPLTQMLASANTDCLSPSALRKVNAYTTWFNNELNRGQMLPVFTRLKSQADHFVKTGRFYFSAK